MSTIPTYAQPDNLPAPLTYGGIQSYTDTYGDVWVAQVGVNGGQWRRAREVLFSKVCRINPINANVATAVMPMDWVLKDTYGLYNPTYQGGAFIIPVAGWYNVVFGMGVTSTAGAQWVDARIYVNSVQVEIVRSDASLASSLSTTAALQAFLNAGDYVQPFSNASVQLAALVGPLPPYAGGTPGYTPGYWLYSTLQYRGTG